MKKLLFLLLLLPVLYFIPHTHSRANAYTPVLTTVKINPEIMPSLATGQNFHLSTLAFDQFGLPIWSGVTYEWGVSSINTVGQVKAGADGKIAEVKALNVGTGDVFVIARHANFQVTTSIKMTVNVDEGACAADINQDHSVGLADYTLLAKYYLRLRDTIPTPRADIDGSGRVDLKDYTILAREYMNTCP